MTVTISGKDYKFEFNAQIGPYYHYEVQFGTSFQDDLQIFSASVPMLRLIYSVLLTDNPDFPLTFEQFLSETSDELIGECSKFLENRFKLLSQGNDKGDNQEKKEEGKNA